MSMGNRGRQNLHEIARCTNFQNLAWLAQAFKYCIWLACVSWFCFSEFTPIVIMKMNRYHTENCLFCFSKNHVVLITVLMINLGLWRQNWSVKTLINYIFKLVSKYQERPKKYHFFYRQRSNFEKMISYSCYYTPLHFRSDFRKRYQTFLLQNFCKDVG